MALLAQGEIQHLEAAASLHDAIKGPVDQTTVQQVPLQPDRAVQAGLGSALVLQPRSRLQPSPRCPSPCRRSCRRRAKQAGLIEPQGEAFGGTTSLEEFAQRRFHHVVAPRLQLLAQPGAGLVENHAAAHIHGVAGEGQGVGFSHHQPLGGGHAGFNQAVGIEIKRRWVIEQGAIAERAEAGIQVVEAFVHQAQRQHLYRQGLGQQWMGSQLRAEAVARPQPTAAAIQQGVAGPLKGQIGG